MEHWVKIAILYAAGAFVLLTDLFIPSHGVLALAGMILIGFGVYEAFVIGTVTGAINVVVWMIVLPVGLLVAVRNWHRTPVGRRISPPNPKLTEKDRMPVSDLQALLGHTGRSLTMLRPVGTCEFEGKRVECLAECGVIEMGMPVQAIGMSDRTVVVRAAANV
jgi:membrane-bound serine protease (ClpP class)